MTNNAEPHYGNGKICYLELPSRNIDESSTFYQAVFDWKVRRRGDGSVAFDDGVGEVSGTWRTDRKPTSDVGMLVHIMVDDIKITMQKIIDREERSFDLWASMHRKSQPGFRIFRAMFWGCIRNLFSEMPKA